MRDAGPAFMWADMHKFTTANYIKGKQAHFLSNQKQITPEKGNYKCVLYFKYFF
jgi:hypothetical protein